MIVEILRNSVSLEFANELRLCECVCVSVCESVSVSAAKQEQDEEIQAQEAGNIRVPPQVVFDSSANNKFSAFVGGGGRHSQRDIPETL